MLLAYGTAGCADDEQPTGAVKVTQVFSPRTPYGVEGSVSFANVSREGETILRGRIERASVTRPEVLLSGSLAPGRYRVTAYQRTCAPSCEALDSISLRCAAPIEVVPDATSAVQVRVDPTREGSWTVAAD